MRGCEPRRRIAFTMARFTLRAPGGSADRGTRKLLRGPRTRAANSVPSYVVVLIGFRYDFIGNKFATLGLCQPFPDCGAGHLIEPNAGALFTGHREQPR